MSGEVVAEAGRSRPLSGGLWTLFSWLRRDERTSSSDSLSSAGSDRTAISFSFLTPAHYRTASPILLPPPSPPTDTYRKRVHDRNLRRQYDQNITLHRKYGLYRGEVGGFDAFSLPPARKNSESNNKDRERRATSECLQRRAAYVPGKRPAPSPPERHLYSGPSTSSDRRTSRKRRAPQPPVKRDTEKAKENIEPLDLISVQNTHQMNSKPSPRSNQLPPANVSSECKQQKINKKDVKTRHEKSFLKQIFENKKRNSTIENSPGKLLPSISELDKQAAEIIENCKLKALVPNGQGDESQSKGDKWFCTRCLRKYDASVVTCLYCLPERTRLSLEVHRQNNVLNGFGSNIYTQTEKQSTVEASSSKEVDDKQKLKDMLKEMKDSLSKRNKDDGKEKISKYTTNSDLIDTNTPLIKFKDNVKIVEAPTLRIGYTVRNEDKVLPSLHTSVSINKSPESKNITEKIQIEKPDRSNTKPQVVTKSIIELRIPTTSSQTTAKIDKNSQIAVQRDEISLNKTNEFSNEVDCRDTKLKIINSKECLTRQTETNVNTENPINLHTPLKISTLLNPVYVPKSYVPQQEQSKKISPREGNPIKLQKDAELKPDSQKKNELRPANISIIKEENVSSKASNPPSTSQTNLIQSKHLPTIEEKLKIGVKTKENSSENVVSSKSDQNVHILNSPKSVFDTQRTTPTCVPDSVSNLERLCQHSRRRELINQLEQSIAKGDERLAAEAAARLAQLRLACSVLSFSSQIVSEPSTSSTNNVSYQAPTNSNEKPKHLNHKSTSTTTTAKSASTVASTISNMAVKPVGQKANDNNEIKTNSVETKSSNTRCSEVLQKTSVASTSKEKQIDQMISISVLIEDKEAARGPVPLQIAREATVGDLRKQAETSLGIASRLQRWIVGRTLCTDDSTPLVQLSGADFQAPFYLCLVESEPSKENDNHNEEKIKSSNAQPGEVYSELMLLEQRALVPNAEPFECGVCMEECAPAEGAVLRECVHAFCRECMSDVIRHSEEPVVSCPAMGCSGVLQEREIRALVTAEEYERWLARSLAAAESGTRNAFHCRTRDCTGWALCEPGVQRFPCPVCKNTNCLPCQAIHGGESCEQYRSRVQEAMKIADGDQTDDITRAFLDTLISRGEALECPECKAIITKKWGCDWVKCSACKTEICWITRGRRWGPGGRGDTSGGCKCGIDGKRCHPTCGYCH